MFNEIKLKLNFDKDVPMFRGNNKNIPLSGDEFGFTWKWRNRFTIFKPDDLDAAVT